MSSNLKKSNQLFRAGLYQEAIDMYKHTLIYMPELEKIINFNIELAQSKISNLNKNSSKNKQNTFASWTTYAMLQSENLDGIILLGGMSIGLSSKEKIVPERILKSVNIFQLCSQVKKSHKIAVYESKKISQCIIKSNLQSNMDVVHNFSNCVIALKIIKYESKSILRLLVEYKNKEKSDDIFILRAYQYAHDNGGALFLVGEDRLDKEDIKKYKFKLINPYMPILITLSNAEGVLIDSSVIPYPSILDGGIHQSECAYFIKSSNSTKKEYAENLLKKQMSVVASKSTWLYGLIQVDIRGAIGTELIFSKEFTQWIMAIFSIRLKIWRPLELNNILEKYWHEVFMTPAQVGVNEKFADLISREKKTRSLLLPSNGIPTLALMTALEDQEEKNNLQHCNFIVEDKNNHSNSKRYFWPDMLLNVNRLLEIDKAVRIPMIISNLKNKNEINYTKKSDPIAILDCGTNNDNLLLKMTPISPDESIHFVSKNTLSKNIKMTLVLTAEYEDLEQFGSFLESIYVQSKVEIDWLYFFIANENNLKRYEEIISLYFKNKYTFKNVHSEGGGYGNLASIASDLRKLDKESYLLFVDNQLICHDKRTIYELASLLEIPKVLTASPMLIELSKSNTITSLNTFRGLVQTISNDSFNNEYFSITQHSDTPETLISVADVSTAIFVTKANYFYKYITNITSASSNFKTIKNYFETASQKGLIHVLTQNVSVTIPNFKLLDINKIIPLNNYNHQNSNKAVAIEKLIP